MREQYAQSDAAVRRLASRNVPSRRECDIAILNGTHATTVAMLLAGKPALHIPIFLEQAINARAAERLGAAICASPTDPQQIIAALRTLLTTDRFSQAAKAFAVRYADFNPQEQLMSVLCRADEVATARNGRTIG